MGVVGESRETIKTSTTKTLRRDLDRAPLLLPRHLPLLKAPACGRGARVRLVLVRLVRIARLSSRGRRRGARSTIAIREKSADDTARGPLAAVESSTDVYHANTSAVIFLGCAGCSALSSLVSYGSNAMLYLVYCEGLDMLPTARSAAPPQQGASDQA